MARMQQRMQQQDSGDGLREKMISINRVTKVVKGGPHSRLCRAGGSW
jgi:small subunit ribosomal protein S5